MKEKQGNKPNSYGKLIETDADLSGNRRSLRFFVGNFYDVRSEKWHE